MSDVKLVGAGGLVAVGTIRKVIKSTNALSEKLDIITSKILDTIEDEAIRGTDTQKRNARSFIVDMKKLTNQGLEMQIDVFRLDMEQRRADIVDRKSAIGSISDRQRVDVSVDKALILLRSTDGEERVPSILPIKQTALEVITQKKQELEARDALSRPATDTSGELFPAADA